MYILLGRGEKGVYKYVDSKVVDRLGSAATDFLVFFGVASIKLPVVVEYALPLGLLILSGVVIVVVMLIVIGPAMNYESWFERSIFVYGYSTGYICHRTDIIKTLILIISQKHLQIQR